MKKNKLSSLERALRHIQFVKEIQNYQKYELLRSIITSIYKISISRLETSQDYKAAEARMIIFSLLKIHTTYSYRMIAILFNIKHHSQIHHSVKLIKNYKKKNLYQTSILMRYNEAERILLQNKNSFIRK